MQGRAREDWAVLCLEWGWSLMVSRLPLPALTHPLDAYARRGGDPHTHTSPHYTTALGLRCDECPSLLLPSPFPLPLCTRPL